MRTLTLLGLFLLAGCGGCGETPSSPAPTPDQGPVTLKEPSTEPGESTGSSAYREAYDRAHDEITIDNARERLDTLNREIEEDLKK